ncbi:hypothetical protein M5C72_08635 [Companilactobacillus allii]|uniref:Uncharacterized protein n=1 Tax=Companilactobacillus allii TaxID=1847728 RepID=A0A1P8Q5M9_9LACO|nr:hypothetical protein [Companilactobacillus allii]APX73145.1 hypothetical protein BTM29_11535 [Companilactobacillus allii]USQ67949.1 hypothetical protein M5C72_08635 [Companilactobacillus allii]
MKNSIKRHRKSWLIVSLCFLISLITISISSSTINVEAKASKTKTEKLNKKINKSMAKSIKEDKGFADGTLDENGNPTQNGTPNHAFDWANYVVKIKMSGKKRVNVHVTTEFSSLSKSDKNNVALKAQNTALQGMEDHKNVKEETYTEGLYTVLYRDGDYVGRSKMSNFKQFKWLK